jgi:hypothetical protein
MGITNSNARFLAQCRLDRVAFRDTLTIGHQQRYIDEPVVKGIAQLLGISADVNGICSEFYSDRFIRDCLGATSLKSLDYSDYEACDIVHDLSMPVSKELENRFDTVIDGGCLEHIFNAGEALANYMRMTRLHGHLILLTMANNHAGHGLYQFSPDFFYAALQPKYGFRIKRMVLEEHLYPSAELGHGQKFYEVVPREQIRGRIAFLSRRPVTIMVLAEKIGDFKCFFPWPVQHSYIEAYETSKTIGSETTVPSVRRRTGLGVLLRKIKKWLHDCLPVGMQIAIQGNGQYRDFLLKESINFRRIELP